MIPLSRSRWAAIAAICGAVSSEACFAPIVVRDELGGTIVDDQSGAPVAGATVCVETWNVGGMPGPIYPVKLADALTVVSDPAGRYSVEKMRERHLFLPFPDVAPAWFPRLTVSHAGYANRVIDSWQRAWWSEGVVPDAIKLRPSTATQPPVSCPTARTVEEMPPESRAPHKRD